MTSPYVQQFQDIIITLSFLEAGTFSSVVHLTKTFTINLIDPIKWLFEFHKLVGSICLISQKKVLTL